MKAPAEEKLDKLISAINGYIAPCILTAIAELDIATLILKNGNQLTAQEAARLSGCDKRACERVMDGMAALGYFQKEGTGDTALYSVAEDYKDYLDSRSPYSFIPYIRHLGCVMRKWTRMSWTLQSGKQQEAIPSILGEEEDRVSFIMGMNSIAMRLRDKVIDALLKSGQLPDKENIRFLDVGGASGTYTEAFLKILPESSAVIFDLPVGIAQAREKFSGSELENRVSLIAGDFTKNDLPTGFDFAWVSAIIHQMDIEDCEKLFAKVYKALNKGGVIAIRDFVMDNQRINPANGAFFGINMLINTDQGRVYTYEEIKQALQKAGFTDVTLAVDRKDMGSVVTARK